MPVLAGKKLKNKSSNLRTKILLD